MLSIAGAPTNGVNEVHRITPGGTISGGTWRITFETQQTAAIAWNATAAEVQAALEALSNVAVGDVSVSGGPLASAAFDITWLEHLGGENRAQITLQSSLTGAAPTITPSTVAAGVTGSFRGAIPGTDLQDTTNAVLYNNTGTAATPVWTVPAAVPTWVLTPSASTAYVDRFAWPTDPSYPDIKLPITT